jgi:hypothetical protein
VAALAAIARETQRSGTRFRNVASAADITSIGEVRRRSIQPAAKLRPTAIAARRTVANQDLVVISATLNRMHA